MDDESADSKPSEEELDLTQDPSLSEIQGAKLLPYNPAKQRESMRGKLAIFLVALLTIVIFFTGIAAVFSSVEFEVIKSLLGLIFTPLMALVGTVVGFYYGGQSPEH